MPVACILFGSAEVELLAVARRAHASFGQSAAMVGPHVLQCTVRPHLVRRGREQKYNAPSEGWSGPRGPAPTHDPARPATARSGPPSLLLPRPGCSRRANGRRHPAVPGLMLSDPFLGPGAARPDHGGRPGPEPGPGRGLVAEPGSSPRVRLDPSKQGAVRLGSKINRGLVSLPATHPTTTLPSQDPRRKAVFYISFPPSLPAASERGVLRLARS
jgi:hypothetical protein